MSKAIRPFYLMLAVLLVAVLLSPAAAPAGQRSADAEKRVIMCGRSVMEGWFQHWGWDWDDSHPVYRNGYTLQHGESLSDLGSMVDIFRNICDSIPEGQDPVMFFKFCFVDFYGDNLGQLQGIVEEVIQIAHDHGLRLIVGNALPKGYQETDAALVNEHTSYNSWLQTKAAADGSLWTYDFYSVLADGSGALKVEYSTDPSGWDAHLNDTAYTALDATYFPLLDAIFADQPPTPPPPEVVRTWYFAEGTTAYGFEEYVLIQNPTVSDAIVQLTYMTPESGAGQIKGDPFYVPASSRTTVNVADRVGSSDVSVKVEADRGVICERSMYWDNRIDGHDSIGVMEPRTKWYLAEGCTAYGFEEYLCIQNPQVSEATVNITYNTSEGPQPRAPLTVAAGSRRTIKVNDDVPPDDVSITLESDRAVVAERAMYWDSKRGGHASLAVSSPSREWFLAEGSTDWGFDTYVLVQNPGGGDAVVDVTFLTGEGESSVEPFTVSAGSRYTIDARAEMGERDFSTRVSSDAPVICERAMYWNNGTGKAGHDTIGVTGSTYNCYLAEGCTAYGFETYLLICNPNEQVNDVQITYMTSEGAVPHGGIKMPPNTRTTVLVNDFVDPGDVSIQVVGEYPVAAERAMYWNSRGGGHDSIGLMEN